MKIVLLQDVKALGKKGTVVEASEGYARNYLLPKKLGVPATAENLNTLKLKKANVLFDGFRISCKVTLLSLFNIS